MSTQEIIQLDPSEEIKNLKVEIQRLNAEIADLKDEILDLKIEYEECRSLLDSYASDARR